MTCSPGAARNEKTSHTSPAASTLPSITGYGIMLADSSGTPGIPSSAASALMGPASFSASTGGMTCHSSIVRATRATGAPALIVRGVAGRAATAPGVASTATSATRVADATMRRGWCDTFIR